jgi:hypothetical protein
LQSSAHHRFDWLRTQFAPISGIDNYHATVYLCPVDG